jgi:hypothetical protein
MKDLKAQLAGIVLVALFLGAPSAFANPVEETVGAVSPSLAETLPELPPVAPLPTPPVQVEPPALPPIKLPPVNLPSAKPPSVKPPAAPRASEGQPAREASPAASAPSGPVDGLTRGTSDIVDRLTGHSGSTGQAVPRSAGVTKGAANPAPDTGPTRAVEPGREAPLRRWVTRVWPAVALGPFGEFLSNLPQALEAVTGASALELRRMLVALRAGTGVGAGDPGGQSAPSAAPQSSQPSPVSIPVGGAISAFILIVASACLLALLFLAVRQELGATDQWWPH